MGFFCECLDLEVVAHFLGHHTHLIVTRRLLWEEKARRFELSAISSEDKEGDVSL